MSPDFSLSEPAGSETIEVVAAVLRDDAGRVLANRRPDRAERFEPALIERIDRITREFGAQWIASGALGQCFGWPADGIHLDTRQLLKMEKRPLPEDKLVIASCHDLEEIHIADSLGADLVTFSPVEATASHPGAVPLGWDDFARVVHRSPLPVIALGGVRPDDWGRARALGAFSVGGIRAFGSR